LNELKDKMAYETSDLNKGCQPIN